MYTEGSYFGDSDVLLETITQGRDGTALVSTETVVFVITRKDLTTVLNNFKNTYMKDMRKIAKERFKYHRAAIEELKLQNQHIKKKLIKNFKFMI